VTQPREGLERKLHPVAIFLARHASSPATLRTYREELTQLATLAGYESPAAVPWHEWAPQQWHVLFEARALRVKPSSLVKTGSVIRGLSKALWTAGLIDGEKRLRIDDLPRHRSATLAAGRSLSEAEVRSLARVCRADCSPAGPRDATILVGLGVSGGLRRAEMCALRLEDYDLTTGELRVLNGKGGRQRTVWLCNGGKRWLDEWVGLRGPAPGPLLCAITRGGRITLEGLSEQSIWKVCRKRGRQAGITPFSPHDLRRTYASWLMGKGADLPTVQALLGNANIATTSNYDRRGEEVKQEAASLIAVPYTKAA
jgi:integrase